MYGYTVHDEQRVRARAARPWGRMRRVYWVHRRSQHEQAVRERGARPCQSDKISHTDIQDDSANTVISHIEIPYPISISRMTISI
jgi:hypothetical protein